LIPCSPACTSNRHARQPRSRGKAIKKRRLIPAEDAHAMARHFQDTKGTTVSVI